MTNAICTQAIKGAAAVWGALYKILADMAAEPPNVVFARKMRDAGVVGWNVGIVTDGVVALMASPATRLWNQRHAAMKYAADDAVVKWGRSGNSAAMIEQIIAGSARSIEIDRDRRSYGLENGVVLPFGDGGYATIFRGWGGPLVMADLESLALAMWFADVGDFAAADRFNLAGLVITSRQAAVCRALLGGATWAGVADQLAISQSAARQALSRVRRTLLEQGRLIGEGRPVEIAEAALRFGLFQQVRPPDSNVRS